MAQKDPSDASNHFRTASSADWEKARREDTLVGTSFGNYQILRKLGEGGMGKVYAAEHPLHGQVAVKVLLESLSSDEEFRQRFVREMKVMQKVSHPNIAKYIGADIDNATGRIYLVTEYLDGEGLDTVLQKHQAEGRSLPLSRALSISSQICSALSSVHRRGIVHRDLKPGNIMLLRRVKDRTLEEYFDRFDDFKNFSTVYADGKEARVKFEEYDDLVKLLDFGISRFSEDATKRANMELTRVGLVMGTPEYMSPEQVKREKIDRRSDIYSLGIIMYEMVTGRLPFEADTPEKVCIMQATKPPRRISEKYPHLSVPKGIEEIVMHSLEKDPKRRFQSVGEMGHVLAFYLAQERRKKEETPTAKLNAAAPAAKSVIVHHSAYVKEPKVAAAGYAKETPAAKPADGKSIVVRAYELGLRYGKKGKARDVAEPFTTGMNIVEIPFFKQWKGKAVAALFSAGTALGLGSLAGYYFKGDAAKAPVPAEEVSSVEKKKAEENIARFPPLSEPAGATIKNEGDMPETTPLTEKVRDSPVISKKKKFSRHPKPAGAVIKNEGNVPETTPLTVEKLIREGRFLGELIECHLTTEPPGANIYRVDAGGNYEPIGRSPVQVQVPRNEVIKFVATSIGYLEYLREIKVMGEPCEVHFTMDLRW